MRAALAVAGWPASLADDLSKRPKVLPNAKAFVDAVLFSSHVDEIFVLRNGVQLLGHDDALPATFTRALQGASAHAQAKALGLRHDGEGRTNANPNPKSNPNPQPNPNPKPTPNPNRNPSPNTNQVRVRR